LYSVKLSADNHEKGCLDLRCRRRAGEFKAFQTTYGREFYRTSAGFQLAAALSLSQEAELEFQDRNNFEIQRMVDLILEIATSGLKWARERESERLDQEQDFVEWGHGTKTMRDISSRN